jgi:hypothetical protein
VHRDRPRATADSERRSPLGAALSAGSVAVAVNTILLAGGDAVGFSMAKGGLLRLLRDTLVALMKVTGLGASSAGLAAATSGVVFQTGFHVLLGLGMALGYAFVIEPRVPGSPLGKSLLYAASVWLINALLVLPLTGEGVAGSAHLGAPAMLGFALAHTLFFILLGTLYARPRRARRSTSGVAQSERSGGPENPLP